MRRPSRPELLATLLFALAASLAAAMAGPPLLRGWSLDALTAIALAGAAFDAPARTAVIALDEETADRPPFRGSPLTIWTPEIARVVDAVAGGGAAVIGFDVVFANSIEDSEIRFGQTTIGDALHGFDRVFLRSIADAASQGKLVLGEAQLGDRRLRPFAGQRFAVGGEGAVRALNVVADGDGVVRRIPATLTEGGRPTPSFALELARRAEPSLRNPGEAPLALNFAATPPIPTFSLGDLDACATRGDRGFFRRAFNGKVVLLGAEFAAGDQLPTSRRFARSRPIQFPSRCSEPSSPPPPEGRATVYGVYVQATAVENLLRGAALRELGGGVRSAFDLSAAAGGALFAATLAPAIAALALLALALGWFAVALFAFAHALALPLFEPMVAAGLALGAMVAFRLGVVDREKRALRRAFGFYLAPSLIDELGSGVAPSLGGEARDVTIFFSDITGFTGLSEVASPREIVALMNDYFTLMSDAIEQAGGYVDKYVGDAVVALFGAPATAEDHAARGVAAALACRDGLAEFNAGRAIPLRHRIGLNSGEALIGNVGSRRRFNFTAIGDSVNLAARIEEICAGYGAEILASDAVRMQTADLFVWREIDTVRARGRDGAITLYEPLGKTSETGPERLAFLRDYAEGLAAWRRGDFTEAAGAFARHADADPPAARFLERCRAMIANPTGADWRVYQQRPK